LFLAEEIHADTLVGILKGETFHYHDENEYNWKGDGDPDDVRGRLDSLEDAEVDDDPGDEGAKPDIPGPDGLLTGGSSNVVGGVVAGAAGSGDRSVEAGLLVIKNV
jgi:hypothetical protein